MIEAQEAIKNLKHIKQHWKPYKSDELANIEYESICICLNLIEKQQKEIEKLRTITQNYDVIDGFTGNDSRIIVCDRKYIIDGTFKRNYIFKSKIREKIKEYEIRLKKMNSKTIGTNKNWVNKSNVDFGIYVLEELLKDN